MFVQCCPKNCDDVMMTLWKESVKNEIRELTEEFNARVYGYRPSSFITLSTAVVAVVSVSCLTIFGAIIDFTSQRKFIWFLRISSHCLDSGPGLVTESNWFIMFMVFILNAFICCIHALTAFAYLPQLTDDANLLSKWTDSLLIYWRYWLWQKKSVRGFES